MKKRLYGVICLCVLLSVMPCACGKSGNPADMRAAEDGEDQQNAGNGDLIPMVMVDDSLYLATGYEKEAGERSDAFDGRITSEVDGSEKPTVNDQSNFGTGYGYRYGTTEGIIEIYRNDKWQVFATEKVIAKDTLIPDESTDHSHADEEAEIYRHVLEEYSDMVRNDFYMDLQGSEDYDSSFGENIGLEIRTHRQKVYYALYDIDGNGTRELIIAGGEYGVSDPAFSPWNYDLYGCDGTGVVRIFPEMEFGYRTNFSLYEGGIIEVFYSGSAAESGVDFYRIAADGTGTELVDSFAVVGHLEGDEPVFAYYRNGNEITEEEYNAGIQKYEVPLGAAPEWIQIS